MARHEVQALWALAAGELAADERLRVESHLAACEACAGELARVRQTRVHMQQARAVEPEVAWDVVSAGLRSTAARRLAKAEPRPRWPWAVALAGACAAMLALWMVTPREVAPSSPMASVGGTVEAGATTVPHGTGGAEAMAAARTQDAVPAVEVLAATQTKGPQPGEPRDSVVLRETGGVERKLEPGMRLRSGMAVRTPARASALLRLPDASRVRLSAGSEVELSRAEERQVHLTVKQGRLSVQASHAERRGFLVEAAGLRVSVVGTVFTVERTEEGAAVAVSEGRVRVEVEGQPPRLVGAGERVELHSQARTLKQQPLSPPDQQAFQELEAPAAQTPVQTVPTGASVADARNDVMPAVARAPQAPASVKPAVGAPGANAGKTQVVTTALRPTGPAVSKSPLSEPREVEPPARPDAAPASGGALAGTAPAAVTPPGDPSQEFAPYPAPSVADALPPPGTKAPEPPVEIAERPEPKKREPLIPMALASKDADERFLGYARLQLGPRTCESFLSSLEEIAQRSPRMDHREQARYLRARCFEEKLQPRAAEGEYRQYLNEFPRGRYAREARTALLP